MCFICLSGKSCGVWWWVWILSDGSVSNSFCSDDIQQVAPQIRALAFMSSVHSFCLVLIVNEIRRRFISASQMATNFWCCHQIVGGLGGLGEDVACYLLPAQIAASTATRPHFSSGVTQRHPDLRVPVTLLHVPIRPSGQTRIEFCMCENGWLMSGDISDFFFFAAHLWPWFVYPQPSWTILLSLYFYVVDLCTGIYLYYFYLRYCVFLNV